MTARVCDKCHAPFEFVLEECCLTRFAQRALKNPEHYQPGAIEHYFKEAGKDECLACIYCLTCRRDYWLALERFDLVTPNKA